MKNILLSGTIVCLMVTNLRAGKDKISVASDQQGAYVYVDGKKKAMTREGFISILLEEGEHTVRVTKAIDASYEYTQSKKIFVGEDISVNLYFTLKQEMTTQSKAQQAKVDASKLARWQRSREVVRDTKLGLMWQDNAAAKSTKKKWKSAKKYCQNLSFGGYSDWKLPNHDELLTIVDYDRYDPAIMPSFKNVASIYYWSSSQYVCATKGAWVVDFKYGYVGYSTKSNENYVKCVRYGEF